MGDLQEYLWKFGKYTYEDKPFSDVDALVMCQMVYPKIEKLVPESGFVTIKQVVAEGQAADIYTDKWFGDMYRNFMGEAATDKRFGSLKMGFFRSALSEDENTPVGELVRSAGSEQMQFAAVTLAIDEGEYFVAFRGTDEKMIGWKEDLNRGILDVLPSQSEALEYLKDVMAAIPGGRFRVGGHSKGGAQAVYAAVNLPDAMKDRISMVYSFDGIGLGEDFYDSRAYRDMAARIHKIIPEESIVGTLFERMENCIVVESEGKSFKQHDFMNWIIEDGHFIVREEVKPGALKAARLLNRGIRGLRKSERRFLVDQVYSMVKAARPSDIYDLAEKLPTKARAMYGAFRRMGKADRKRLVRIIGKLLNPEKEKK